jgi:amino acid transporter
MQESAPNVTGTIEHKNKNLPLGAIIVLAVVGGVFVLIGVVQLTVFSLVGIMSSTLFIGLVALLVIGLFCLGFLFLRLRNQRKIRDWLKTSGTPITATFVKLVLAYARINRQQMYRVQLRWIDPVDGKAHLFYSGYVNPNLFAEPPDHNAHTVYVNPKNFDDYFVQLNLRQLTDA